MPHIGEVRAVGARPWEWFTSPDPHNNDNIKFVHVRYIKEHGYITKPAVQWKGSDEKLSF